MAKEKKLPQDKKNRRACAKQNKCIECGNNLTNASQALTCDMCAETRSCIRCLNMNPDLYELLQTDANMKWNCDSCSREMKNKTSAEDRGDLKEMMIAMQKQLARMETMLTAKVDRAEHEQLEARVTMLEEQDEQIDPEEINKLIDKRVEEQIEEYRERERRKFNLIVHNMAENDAETSEERRQHDHIEMERTLQAIDCGETEIDTVQRLGERRDDKPRIIILKMKKVADKRKILMSTKKLREDEQRKNMYITPDMSKKSREHNKKLRTELKERREAGEGNLIIRNGKIMEKEQAPNERHIFRGNEDTGLQE